MSTSATSQTYRQAASEKYNALRACYKDGTDSYWRLGNALDTVIDYFDIVDASDAPAMAKIVVDRYNQSLNAPPPLGLGGYDNAWFDDFGWWTIAAQRATRRAYFPQAFFRDVQEQCWSRFTANAPYVWERRGRDPDRFASCRPAFDGGAWNEYWLGTPATYPGPKGANPLAGTLEGIQNTVTNALYLIGAQRVGDQAAGDREFGFLRNWFRPAQQGSLWWQDRPESALVRERVPYFYAGTSAPGYQPDWAWTGDQGLVLGAFADRLSLAPVDSDYLLTAAKRLLAGVRSSLVDSGDVLRSWTISGRVPDGDEQDYETGPGVFWRYALRAYLTVPDLRAVIAAPDYLSFVRANADAAVKSGAGTLDLLTNDLAALVAAVEMLP